MQFIMVISTNAFSPIMLESIYMITATLLSITYSMAKLMAISFISVVQAKEHAFTVA